MTSKTPCNKDKDASFASDRLLQVPYPSDPNIQPVRVVINGIVGGIGGSSPIGTDPSWFCDFPRHETSWLNSKKRPPKNGFVQWSMANITKDTNTPANWCPFS